jgi:excisionase family DNA binding protein
MSVDQSPTRLDASEEGNGANPLRSGGLLTAEDLAARWQVPASQVYRLTREGRLPVVRLGRYYRYALAAVEAFERGGGTHAE